MEIPAQTVQPNRRARHVPGGRKKIRQWLSVIGMLVVSVLAVRTPAPAAAASSSGAIHINNAGCFTEEESDFTLCYTLEGVTTQTMTPVGNVIASGSLKVTSTTYDPAGALVLAWSGTQHFQNLTRGDRLHVQSNHLRTTTTTADGSPCTVTIRFHEANEQTQFNYIATDCS